MLCTMLFLVLCTTMVVLTSSLDLVNIGKELDRTFDLDFFKDYFKFHLYVDPHPVCALEDELCTLDNNCCSGLECKVTAGRDGVSYTCQPEVEDSEKTESQDTAEDDVRWSVATGPDAQSGESASLLREIYRSRLDGVKQHEDRLLNDQYTLIKELQKPLGMEEMRELQQAKEVEDYKRERELKELREWVKNRELEEDMKAERKKALEKIAKDRVAKVLKEEERQKLEMFRKIQEAMKQGMQAQPKTPLL